MVPEPRLSIPGIISATRDIQDAFHQRCQAGYSACDGPNLHVHSGAPFPAIQEQANRVSRILEEKGKTAAHLPIRSRRAYQWLLFLMDKEIFSRHIKVLTYLYDELQRMDRPLPTRGLEARFKLYLMGPLYQVRPQDQTLQINVHQSFLIARPAVLQSLLKLACGQEKGSAKAVIDRFTLSPSFASIRETLAYLAIPRHALAQGQTQDLLAVFQRVNQTYFAGNLSPPHLVWSSRDTFRKFGHYEFETDTVMISRTLDRSDIPDLVLDYVMFHELLHKTLGYRQIKGRRYAHTAEFQAQEKVFQGYQKARSYLEHLSKNNS